MEPYLLTCIESRVENSRNFYGQFQVAPFLPEDAVTIANSLRRSLLSEISGVAITHVVMEGEMHEYSTVAGVRESVLDILLNVKQIVLTSSFQLQEPQIGFLQVQGPGIVRASDIKLPISVQIVDPEQYIATLLYDGLLKIKFVISRGKNYMMPLRRGVDTFIKITPDKTKIKDFSKRSLKPKTNLNSKKPLSFFEKIFRSLGPKTNLNSKKPLSFFEKRYIKSEIKRYEKDEELKMIFIKREKAKRRERKRQPERQFIEKDKWAEYAKDIIKPVKNFTEFKKEIIKLKSKDDISKDEFTKIARQVKRLFREKKKSQIKRLFIEKKKFGKYTVEMAEQRIMFRILQKKAKKELFKKYKIPDICYPVSIFPIDAVFMPINKVNFAIETNDLSETPKDRVVLEIWTNGSIHPKQAIHEAAKALIQLIAPLQEPKNFKNMLMVPSFKKKQERKKRKQIIKKGEKVEEKKKRKQIIKKEEKVIPNMVPNSVDIGNLNLSVRPSTCLKLAKIETVADLLQYSSEELLNLKNFGKGSLNQVEKILNQMGLKLRS